MSTLLEALLTFVGVMFILALAAQSIQELIKTMFVLRGQAMKHALAGLIGDAAGTFGLNRESANAILQELFRRLQDIGQKGWFQRSLRLDSLPADQLKELIATVDPTTVPALQIRAVEAKTILAAIGAQAEKFYDLAMNPVAERYKRRMRVLAVGTSLLVVVPLNMGAKRLWDSARTDPSFRQSVIAVARAIDTLPADSVSRVADSVAAATADSATKARIAATRRSLAQGKRALAALTDTSIFRIGPPRKSDLGSPGWWLGIVVSVLFVSMGAPFWHDLFEMIFGLKQRARRDPEKRE